MTNNERSKLARFVDSGEQSYNRLAKEYHGKANNRPISPGVASQAPLPKGTNGSRADGTDSAAIQNAIAAAVTLGVRRARAVELARQCLSDNPGEILTHIMRNH